MNHVIELTEAEKRALCDFFDRFFASQEAGDAVEIFGEDISNALYKLGVKGMMSEDGSDIN